MSFEQTRTAFQHKNFHPIYFIYGDEPFLMDELQHLLLENALAPHEKDFNLDVFYGADSQGVNVVAACNAFPMMAERRVVIVREFEKLNGNILLADYVKHPNPTCVVFLICNKKPALNTNPYKALYANATSIEIKALKDAQIPAWIEKRVYLFHKQIKPDAVQILADLIGTNLRDLANEIDKLVALVGNRGEILREDVLEVSGMMREHNVFELQKALVEADYTKAVLITEHILRQKNNAVGDALILVATLSTFFTRLWKLAYAKSQRQTEAQMAGSVGINAYFLKEYLNCLKHYPLTKLNRAFSALLSADYELKGGSSRPPATIMHLLLQKLMQ